MKRILFISLVIISSLIIGCVVIKPLSSSLTTYEKKYTYQDQTKNTLYIKANEWFVSTFNYAESVIEFQDKEAGKIIGKYVSEYTKGGSNYLSKQIISIDIKDNRVRLIIKEPQSKETFSIWTGRNKYDTFKPITSINHLEKIKNKWFELAHSLDEKLKTNNSW